MRHLCSIILLLTGLSLGIVALFGAVMLAFPPVQAPPGVRPDCCLQYAPLLLGVPVAVLFAFGFSARCLWRGHYPDWRKNWQSKALIVLHGFCWLVSLTVLWIWVVGIWLS